MGKTKSRGNGQGTAYKRGDTWTAQVVIGYKPPTKPGGQPVPVKRTKGGFAKKKDAIAYCPLLFKEQAGTVRYTLKQVYESWEPFYSPRTGESTMKCYAAAYKHFSALHNKYIDLITAGDLQDCIRLAGGETLVDCRVFDVYTGVGIAPGKKSVAFSLTMRSDDQTLTDDHAEAIVQSVLTALKEKFGAQMR